MIEIKKITNIEELYFYHTNINSPYIFKTDYDEYLISLCKDNDSYGNKLFEELYLLGAYNDSKLVGFIQYGKTNIGFDGNGEISEKINYSVIRNLYFEDEDVGEE